MTLPMAAMPEHERPRERLETLGAESLTERELLALVLRNGTKGLSAIDLAGELLAEYGGLTALAQARCEELAVRRGIGSAKAAAIVAAFELGRRHREESHELPQLRTLEDVADAARRQLSGLRRERVVVLVCDSANRLTRTVTVSEGAIDRSLVPVREILNAVLRHDGRAFALAHNHPGGDPAPSDADQKATAGVAEGAKTLGLRFLGHVVIAAQEWSAVS